MFVQTMNVKTARSDLQLKPFFKNPGYIYVYENKNSAM